MGKAPHMDGRIDPQSNAGGVDTTTPVAFAARNPDRPHVPLLPPRRDEIYAIALTLPARGTAP